MATGDEPSGNVLSILSQVVQIGCVKFKEEDDYLRRAVGSRGEKSGILRVRNERYFQFLLWHAVLPTWHAEIERDGMVDLIITSNGKHHFEMKNWREDKDGPQLKSIQNDVAKLKRMKPGNQGYILIVSANEPMYTERNFEHLETKVNGLFKTNRKSESFRTTDAAGNDIEFWIAGWAINE